MALGGALLHGGGAHSARTLYFFTKSLNNCFQTVYSCRWAFLTLQKKNWPNCCEIGRVINILVWTSNFFQKLAVQTKILKTRPISKQ